MKTLFLGIAVCCFAPLAFATAQQSTTEQKPADSMSSCPMHDAHAKMNERGEKGMGFLQSATTHHFLLQSDGGVIQVEVNDPADTENRDNIRTHLKHIALAFASGDFDIPMFVHDTVPPGVPEMKRLQNKIRYTFEETQAGGRVVIFSADADSLAAIKSFLRFQIEEHKTGDPTDAP